MSEEIVNTYRKTKVMEALRDRRILGVQFRVIDQMIPTSLANHLAITMRKTRDGGVTFSLIYFFFDDMTKGHVVLRQDVSYNDIKIDLEIIAKNASLHHFDIVATLHFALTEVLDNSAYED